MSLSFGKPNYATCRLHACVRFPERVRDALLTFSSKFDENPNGPIQRTKISKYVSFIPLSHHHHHQHNTKMSFYRIQLKRSTIALPQAIKDTVSKLGLGKTGSVSYRPVSPIAAGMILKVKELVEVKVVDQALSKQEERALRKSDPGFVVEKQQ